MFWETFILKHEKKSPKPETFWLFCLQKFVLLSNFATANS